MTRNELLGRGTVEAYLLSAFAAGRYISDVHLGSVADVQVRALRVLLSMFVRGRVYLHFESSAEVVAALEAAGFASAEVCPAADIAGEVRNRVARLAHILEASIT
jgi:hypothetical protein